MKAYAKINLALDVLGRRADGYHELAGIMHSIDLFDEVSIMPSSSARITVECNEFLPPDNTAYKAAKLYFSSLTNPPGVVITIEKHVPSQAGLGGASADAAAVLRILNDVYGLHTEAELYEIGKRVGADVPFCLHGGCALAEGIGERLTALPVQNLHLLLVKGKAGISTKELFAHHDTLIGEKNRDTRLDTLIEACKARDTEKLCKNCFNTLETAAFDFLPELAQTKKFLLEHTDAKNALMTGSGSVIYGIYDSAEKAEKAERIVRENSAGAEFVKAVGSLLIDN